MGDGDGDCQFGLWGRVLSAIALYLLPEGWPVGGLSLVLVGRTWLVVQLEGLGDGCQRLRNSFSANLIFSSGVSSSYPRGKGLDKCKLFWFGEVLEKGVAESKEGNETGPVSPEFFSGFASLSHDPMGCRSRRSSAQTNEEILVLRVCICQEASCDNGKERLNLARN